MRRARQRISESLANEYLKPYEASQLMTRASQLDERLAELDGESTPDEVAISSFDHFDDEETSGPDLRRLETNELIMLDFLYTKAGGHFGSETRPEELCPCAREGTDECNARAKVQALLDPEYPMLGYELNMVAGLVLKVHERVTEQAPSRNSQKSETETDEELALENLELDELRRLHALMQKVLGHPKWSVFLPSVWPR